MNDMDRHHWIRHLGLAGFVAVLAACASSGPAPVEDRSIGSRTVAPQPEARPASATASVYKVQRGDTLYSIAFRNGADYRELAGWNGISAPYTIYVGQELRLGPRAATKPAAATRSPSTPVVATATPPPKRPTAAVSAMFEDVPPERAGTSTSPSSSSPAATAAATPPPPATVAPATPPSAATAATTAAPKPAETAPPPAAGAPGDVAWRWPADGKIVGTFVTGDQTRQGIDIAGKAGDPVRAAADGSVVYSGNGLIGYGELIIVKHSPAFLSAYGYNRKRLVKEGDPVKAGQVIAEMGSSSASRDSVHFEIRRNGKPTNPLDYLPRR